MTTRRIPVKSSELPTLLCFSHLRWNFVYQRPQHLISRAALKRAVYFIEEPVSSPDDEARLAITRSKESPNVHIVVPHLPTGHEGYDSYEVIEELLSELLITRGITRYDAWYYTPMALKFTRTLYPEVVVYDCMDELSGFNGAPSGIADLEIALMQRADLVFTGGRSLYEVKYDLHTSVHCFPSSIDIEHFLRGRKPLAFPHDQEEIPRPRCGFYGVIDERFDIDLLDGAAQRAPQWHFVVLGPVVKISPERLPKRVNIHYLGQKSYNELPYYLSGWDVAIMPFAHNPATRFISPTKTPEYLAAGCPVVSTSIRDVVRPYGESGLVSIADTPEDFVRCLEYEKKRRADETWQAKIDAYLAGNSWDQTWIQMTSHMERVRGRKLLASPRNIITPEAIRRQTNREGSPGEC